jgi:transposase
VTRRQLTDKQWKLIEPFLPIGEYGPYPERLREHQTQQACWPQALRAVRGWLTPWATLQRYWRAWTAKPPPTELQALINAVGTGRPLNLYLPA